MDRIRRRGKKSRSLDHLILILIPILHIPPRRICDL